MGSTKGSTRAQLEFRGLELQMVSVMPLMLRRGFCWQLIFGSHIESTEGFLGRFGTLIRGKGFRVSGSTVTV